MSEQSKDFGEQLRDRLRDPAFRDSEGFPRGTDEAIASMSAPPFFTACPNPFLAWFLADGTRPDEPAHDHPPREAFAADVSEGKNDPIYNAHSYHTKMPHRAIMRHVLHYTRPGDVVLDGFCGTGMTGVAAQLCGERAVVESLGYTVDPEGVIADAAGKTISQLGARRAVLCDLSPAATFIAYNYNTPVDAAVFRREAAHVLEQVEAECGWMYSTLHQPDADTLARSCADLRSAAKRQSGGRINWTVWSDVFVCPRCRGEVVYWSTAVDLEAGAVRDEFACPHCRTRLRRRLLERAWVEGFDGALQQTIRQARRVPVLVNYSVGRHRFTREPDEFDRGLLEVVQRWPIPHAFPVDRMPEGEESRRNDVVGLTHPHHFYTKRNLAVFSSVCHHSRSMSHGLHLLGAAKDCQSYATRLIKLNVRRLLRGGGQFMGFVTGTLYVPSLHAEQCTLRSIRKKFDAVPRNYPNYPDRRSLVLISTTAASHTALPAESVDYIFIDPPFGGNLMYSELNFLWETWMRVFTNPGPEAIENRARKKDLADYQRRLTDCFREFYRVLRPGRWMTVVFHHSHKRVWSAIQEALRQARFVVCDVRSLDRRQGTFKQYNCANSVKQDLVISCCKPAGERRQHDLQPGSEQAAWDFVHEHLKHLPVRSGAHRRDACATEERRAYLLFSRMVAFHVRHGLTVPLSAADFYAGLAQRFEQRDGMYFLPEQANEFDRLAQPAPVAENW
jgi:hypothetical protein